MSVFYTAGYEAASPLPMTHPRILWDPLAFEASGAPGLGTNLLLRSQEFDNATWTKTRSSITANATTSPTGSLTADKLVEDASAANSHFMQQVVAIAANQQMTLSMYIKAAGRTRGRVSLSNGLGSVIQAQFNLTDGTVSGSPGVDGVVDSVSITPVGNGWFRVHITGTPVLAGASINAQLILADATGNTSYNGDNTSGMFVWGAQLQLGALRAYIATTAAAATQPNITSLNMDRMGIPDTSTYASISGTGERSFVADFGQLQTIDAVGLAGHNLGGLNIILEGATNAGLTTWTPLYLLTPDDDSTLLMLIEPVALYGVRVRVFNPTLGVATDIAVLYAGVALVMPVRGYGELGPIDLGMDVMINTYRTESGQISGRFVDYTGLRGSLTFLHLREDWVRATLIPFLKQAIRIPFFIANRPSGYPDDCAYAWTIQNVIPQRMKMKNYMSVQMEVHAHAPATLF